MACVTVGAHMQNLSRVQNIAEMDALVEAHGGMKAKLVDRQAIFESVSYLQSHGFDDEEVQRCLVRYFHVDLDLLYEALTTRH